MRDESCNEKINIQKLPNKIFLLIINIIINNVSSKFNK